jgi:hypothetical protein
MGSAFAPKIKYQWIDFANQRIKVRDSEVTRAGWRSRQTRSPGQLAPQLLGRLPADSGPEIAWLRQAARTWRGFPWLCPLQVQMKPPSILLRVFDRHETPVLAVSFSPDGTRTVSGSLDKTLRLWDAQSGQPIGAPMQGPYGYGASSVSLSPDGTRIVSGKCRQDAAALGPCVVNQPNSLPCNHTGNVKVTCVACRRVLRLFVQVTHEFDFKPEPAIRMRVTQRRKKRVASIQFCIDATPSATWLFQCLNYPPASCDGAVLAL